MLSIIHKIPVLTTLLSAWFFVILYKHWNAKGRPAYLFWWTLGVLAYGLGTLTESVVGLWGWSAPVFKAWYVMGALLGGFPLAQGSVFLMFSKRTATIMGSVVLTVVIIATALVLISPIDYSRVEATRLTGHVLQWGWVRLITPIINIYAFIFLVGGAFYSAYKYSQDKVYRNRFLGNLFIAFGGLLPGIGGSFTKFGYTEVLYVTELAGIILIYLGYATIRNDNTISVFTPQQMPR